MVDEIAREVGRTRAQVMLRWALEHGHAVVPLSTDERHLRENLAVREFQLTPAQVHALDNVRLAASAVLREAMGDFLFETFLATRRGEAEWSAGLDDDELIRRLRWRY